MPQSELPKQMLHRLLQVAQLLARAEMRSDDQSSAATTNEKTDGRSPDAEHDSTGPHLAGSRLDKAQDVKKHSE